jgi:hypothetical protein
VAIEALGLQVTFETACGLSVPVELFPAWACTRASCEVPYEAFAAGLGDHTIVTTLCPVARSGWDA